MRGQNIEVVMMIFILLPVEVKDLFINNQKIIWLDRWLMMTLIILTIIIMKMKCV